MKLLYISCHAILEYDELVLFSELGIDVFSMGAYRNPYGGASLPRPAVEGLTYYPAFEHAALRVHQTGPGELPAELIDWADTIMFMHMPEMLAANWPRIRDKRVMFRSIGQSVPHQEALLQTLTSQGLEIVRYSPAERRLGNYAGEKALIRFYKDPQEYEGYLGRDAVVIVMSQSIHKRAVFCFHDEIQEVLAGFPNKIYGFGNEDLGPQWGGNLTYDEQKEVLRTNRLLVYGGTWPACYTLAFIEAWMTGIPILSIGPNTALNRLEHLSYFEVPELITSGYDGVVSDDINELREYARFFLENLEMARIIGRNGRSSAIKIFGKDGIKAQWKDLLLGA